MPGLVQRCTAQPGNAASCTRSPGSAPAHGVWSKQRDDVGLGQLQKFWSELAPQARHELLRIDKHTLFEQARKNLYCSRCNGLLLEGFSQIVMYGKSLQLECGGVCAPADVGGGEEDECNEAANPSVHPWGGLTASRDGMLSLMDCYLYGKSLWVLQSVFDSARAREHERELLYPDACGGGGRGWMSHGTANYGRIARETCALHTARLSCDTLVDFWSALGDETRLSLFRMKEEDFIERLMYRFDSKRFCRDCRKNVIREFKELKELKRMRREPRCTAWFCAADTAFQYEVSKNKVQAEWHQCFIDSSGAYHHFEWAVGSGEGKTDILAFEDVGSTRDAIADGLELEALDACYITLRACRLDGRFSELTVKAHALKGKACVHRRLIVGDSFVTITKGESIRSFFDHAEEAEEEEDDDTIDKDGNELDGDGSRPQKHAKSPELAREFLLDAATVIFKGQVEKAFREGTARQNAHSLFVCLALKLLEERLHVACKEIITFEKQVKLLEEEEKEKREEEERRERRRAKEREKKLRRKERLRGKERERERKDVEIDPLSTSRILEVMPVHDEVPAILDEGVPRCEAGEPIIVAPFPHETPSDQIFNGFASTRTPKSDLHIIDAEFHDRDINGSFLPEQSRSSRRRLRFHHDLFQERVFEWSAKDRSVEDGDSNARGGGSESKSYGCRDASSRCTNSGHRFCRESGVKTSAGNPTFRFNEKLVVHGAKNRTRGRLDYHSCNCNQPSSYRGKDFQFTPVIRSSREVKGINTMEAPFRFSHQNDRQSHRICATDASVASKEKQVPSRSNTSRDICRKQVWEPTDSRKKTPGSEVERTISVMAVDSPPECNKNEVQNECEGPCNLQSPDDSCLLVESVESAANSNDCMGGTNSMKVDGILSSCTDAFDLVTDPCFSKVGDEEAGSFSASPTSTLNNDCNSMASSSSSDNCSSCISEADCSTSSFSARNAESSSTSDSEDVNQQFDGRETPPVCSSNEFCTFRDGKENEKGSPILGSAPADSFNGSKAFRDDPSTAVHNDDIGRVGYEVPPRQQRMSPAPRNGIHSAYLPMTGYHIQHPTSWAATHNNGLLSFSQPHHYLIPGSFGYGIPACHPPDFYMHYGGLQPLTNSVVQVSRAPLFQNASKINTLNFNRDTENIAGAGSHANAPAYKPNFMTAPNNRPPHENKSLPEPIQRKKNHNAGNLDESHDGISSFSLFHFNGPVAVASGNGLDPMPSKNKKVLEAELNQNLPERETVVEEFSLFASRSGSPFSFF